VHEAGHAVAYHAYGALLEGVFVALSPPRTVPLLPILPEYLHLEDVETVVQEAIVCLAGPIATKIILGEDGGVGNTDDLFHYGMCLHTHGIDPLKRFSDLVLRTSSLVLDFELSIRAVASQLAKTPSMTGTDVHPLISAISGVPFVERDTRHIWKWVTDDRNGSPYRQSVPAGIAQPVDDTFHAYWKERAKSLHQILTTELARIDTMS
jgi:hypothetical protein